MERVNNILAMRQKSVIRWTYDVPTGVLYNPPRLRQIFPMDANDESTEVEIFGQTYNVRGEGDPDYLMELARFVDSRMRDVAAQVATVDPLKIAILAALNIADEFSRYRKRREDAAGIWIEKTEEISGRLDKVIS